MEEGTPPCVSAEQGGGGSPPLAPRGLGSSGAPPFHLRSVLLSVPPSVLLWAALENLSSYGSGNLAEVS